MNNMYPRIVIAGNKRGSGKSTVSIGLIRALHRAGYNVAPFKKGPDFLDPMWLRRSAAQECFNLDPYLFGGSILDLFLQRAPAEGLSIIEGNHGIYDSPDNDGQYSTAHMSRDLKAPVLLVVDVRGVNRTAAPLIKGILEFEPNTNFAGIILNNTGGERHIEKIRSSYGLAMQKSNQEVPILGAIPYQRQSQLLERHLGLIPAEEMTGRKDNADDAFDKSNETEKIINQMADIVETNLDIDKILEITKGAIPLESSLESSLSTASRLDADNRNLFDLGKIHSSENNLSGFNSLEKNLLEIKNEANKKSIVEKSAKQSKIRIGVAYDKAFNFYYSDNFLALQKQGAELVMFSPLSDPFIPDVDALYFGGGYPEVFIDKLETNQSMMESIRKVANMGLPIYAECGGLLYLSSSIVINGKKHTTVGCLPLQFEMTNESQARGYVDVQSRVKLQDDEIWQIPEQVSFQAHEFHFTKLTSEPEDVDFLFMIKRGAGIWKNLDGVHKNNILAGYFHLHNISAPWWATAFLQAAILHKGKES